MPTSSVDCPQLSFTDELVSDETAMAPGIEGATLSRGAWEVAVVGAERADSDPAIAVTR